MIRQLKPNSDRLNFAALERHPLRRVGGNGDDIGQEGWCTAAEHAEIADLLDVGSASRVLDVCCGSGGPSLALVQRVGCRLTGVDREDAAIACAQAQASSRALAERATFALADCNKPLPFEDGSFDALLCIDAILHLRDRFGTLSIAIKSGITAKVVPKPARKPTISDRWNFAKCRLCVSRGTKS
jgi:SAM-dependent methyltransferase